MSDKTHIARINALTSNARQTWFALLAALIFVGVTLMSVEHIDFYGVGRATTLPIVNFDVPTRFFFYAAPILIAAIYGYFHLYLIRLWDALGNADAGTTDNRLGDAVSPWLVTDAALMLRLRRRRDGCTTHRTLEMSAMLLNTLLAWAFGLIILAFLWWSSMPARDWVMTGIAGVALILSAITGYVSLRLMWLRMGPPESWPKIHVTSELPYAIGVTLMVPAVLILSHSRTVEPSDWVPLAPIDMVDEPIVERPAGWLPYDLAREDFLATWCKRESAPCQRSDLNAELRLAFDAEWEGRRAAALVDMRRPDWHKWNSSKPDFRNATLSASFLVGANLVGAQMNGAFFSRALMEGAILFSAEAENAFFADARMEGVDLSMAMLNGALFEGAELEGAFFFDAQMEYASLSDTQLQRAQFVQANMQGAVFINAQMEGAVFVEAMMQDAVLRLARMDDANFRDAHLHGADLSDAQMLRAFFRNAVMPDANLFGARMNGADFSGAQMHRADLRTAQMNNATLHATKLHQADLRRVKMNGTDLYGAEMPDARLQAAEIVGGDLREIQWTRAVFDFSQLLGTRNATNVLSGTHLQESTNNGGALRFVDLSETRYDALTDWRNVFLDGSVALTPEFRAQMGEGNVRGPCQWVDDILEDAEFYGRWRGWVETAPDSAAAPRWYQLAPDRFEDVAAIPPNDPSCVWKTEPMLAKTAE